MKKINIAESVMDRSLTVEGIMKSTKKEVKFYNTITQQFMDSYEEGFVVWGYTEFKDSIIINLTIKNKQEDQY
jgi:hypothetical protein